MISCHETIEILTAYKPELVQKYPIEYIALFGSITRNDFTSESDIDIVVQFNGKIGIEFIDLADELERRLNWKVDLVSRDAIKAKYFEYVEKDMIYI